MCSCSPQLNVFQPASDEDCEGLGMFVVAIGESYQRAETRGKDDRVYCQLLGTRKRAPGLSAVRLLEEEDSAGLKPTWYKNKSFSTTTNGETFRNFVKKVEGQVEGFTWSSWYAE